MRTWRIELGRGERILCGDGSRLNVRNDRGCFVFLVIIAVPKNHGQCRYPRLRPINYSVPHEPGVVSILPLARFGQPVRNQLEAPVALLCASTFDIRAYIHYDFLSFFIFSPRSTTTSCHSILNVGVFLRQSK